MAHRERVDARHIRLSIGGKPFRILGTDGGLLEAPFPATEVLLTPADRVDLAVGPFAEGERVAVEALRSNRGTFKSPRTVSYASLRIGPAAPSRAGIPDVLRKIEPLVTGKAGPTREVRLGWKLAREHGVAFTINKESHHRADPVRIGELQIWDVVNGSPIHHPFHLHDFFFQVLEVNGKPPPFLSWEDTVDIPARGRVRIAWMPDDRPGSWMYHCHILEHHAGGMMAPLRRRALTRSRDCRAGRASSKCRDMVRHMIAALVISGAFAAYFLISGIRALTSGRIMVVNPNNSRSSPGLIGALLWRMRQPPPVDASTGLHIEATGSEARSRAVLHIVLGLAFVAAFIATLVAG